jgi:hypothetical protein
MRRGYIVPEVIKFHFKSDIWDKVDELLASAKVVFVKFVIFPRARRCVFHIPFHDV